MIELTDVTESSLLVFDSANLRPEKFRELTIEFLPVVFGCNITITLNGTISDSVLDIQTKESITFTGLGIDGSSYSPVIVINHPSDSELDETITLPDVNSKDILELYFSDISSFKSLIIANLNEFGATNAQKQKVGIAIRKTLAQYLEQEIIARKAEIDNNAANTKNSLDSDVVDVRDISNT